MRRFILFSVFLVLLGPVSWAIPPDPPLEVHTTFKSAEGTAGALTIQVTAHQALSGARLLVSAPRVLSLRATQGEMTRKDLDRLTVEYSLALPEKIERGGTATTTIEFSAPQSDLATSEVEVRVVARTETGETAVGHASLLATVRQGRLLVQRPEEFQRELRIAAEKIVQENARKEPGLTIASVLVERVTKLDEAAVREADSRSDSKLGEVLPSPLSKLEREAFIDRSREVEAELDPLTVRGRAFFVDFDGVLRPLVNATVRIMDDDWGPDEHIRSTITGFDGRFSAVINNDDGWFQDGRDIYILILTTNSRFRVEDCSFWPDWTYTWRANDGNDLPDGTIVDFGSFSLAGSTNGRRAAMVFQRMNSAWSHFTAVGAQDPGFVDGCYPESPTVYDTFWGEIDISGDDFDSRDIIVHEWGHAIQDNAQWFNVWSGAAHSFCGLTSREQAFVEGWATFVALDVFPDNRFNWNPGDTGQELENYMCGASRGADGPRDEGRIAAALIDLRDRPDDCANGCGETCDNNSSDAVSLRTIWRDAMWNTIGIFTDDAFEFWRELCPVLTASERPPAVNLFDFNCIDVTECVVPSQVLTRDTLTDKEVYPALVRLRDELKKTEAGRMLVDAFFRMAPALVESAEKSPEAKEALSRLRTSLALAATWLTDEKGQYEGQIPITAELLRDFDVAAKHLSQSGEEATRDVTIVRRLLESLEGKTVAEIRAKLGADRKRVRG